MVIINEMEPPSSPNVETQEKTKTLGLINKIKNQTRRGRSFLAKAGYLNLPTLSDQTNVANSSTVMVEAANSEVSDKARNFVVKKNLSSNFCKILPHVALSFLSLVVVFSNINDRIVAKDFYEQLVYVDSPTQYTIAQSIGDYTPLISDDAESVKKAALADATGDGFASSIGTVATEVTSREEPLPDNSSQTVNYAVKEGDTLSGIGWKFNVKIASIKYANDLDADTIRPGAVLKIPPKGYEVPKSVIDKKNAEKARLAASRRNTITRNATVARAAGSSERLPGGPGLIVPLNHGGVSQYFSGRHTGIDYRADVGTPVASAASGVIMSITGGWSGGYGNQILVNHGNGVVTRYAHLSKVAVSVGESVGQGEIIGYSGNSGRSTGPHLHFEKIIGGRPTSPF